MTKSASITIICVICAIALVLGVFACLPDGLEFGNYNIYHAPVNLIQGDSLFSNSIITTYKVKLDENNEAASTADIVSAIRSRLGNMYGRYFCDVNVNTTDDATWDVSVKVPVTANGENTSALAILADVTSTGKVEFLKDSSYSASNVVLTSANVVSTKTQRYTYGDRVYYIVNMKLDKAGQELASKNFTASSSSWSAYLAIDGQVSFGVAYGSNGELQVYTNSDAQSARLIGFVKSGALCGTLTSVETFTADDSPAAKSVGGLVFGLVVAAIVLGSWIFYLVRYKTVAVAAIVSQLVAIVTFILFSGMVYFSILNIFSAIAIILGYGLMSTFTCLVLGKIRTYSAEKTYAAARFKAFSENNKWNLIVHAIVLVVGIILWVIPTGVTVPLGNVLVYAAILSFVVTMGLNRLFTSVVAPLGLDEASAR